MRKFLKNLVTENSQRYNAVNAYSEYRFTSCPICEKLKVAQVPADDSH